MTIAWPAVGTGVLPGSYTEAPPENSIRSSMDVGPAKVRQRGTSAPRKISWRQLHTTAQIATMDTFYVTTTSHGSLDFTRAHPRTGSTVNMRFLSPPVYVIEGGLYWIATYSCEVLP